MPARLEQSWTATAAIVGVIRNAVVAAVVKQSDERECRSAVALCTTELCSNVVRHAYPRAPGEIAVSARRDDGLISIRVVDSGVGFGHSGRHGTGVGLTLVGRLARSVCVSRVGNRTVVEADIECGPADPGRADVR